MKKIAPWQTSTPASIVIQRYGIMMKLVITNQPNTVTEKCMSGSIQTHNLSSSHGCS